MHAELNTFGLQYLLWLSIPTLHGIKNKANSVIPPFLLIASSCKTKCLHVSFLSTLCNFKPLPYKCSWEIALNNICAGITQLVPLSTGWQTSEVLRVIFATAVQPLQLKQTWWFPAIFFPLYQSQEFSLPVLFKVSFLFGTGFGQVDVCLSFSSNFGMALANPPPWKSKGPPAAAYGTSLLWIPVGHQESQLYSSSKHAMPHSQTSDDARSDSLLHLGGRMRVTTALIPLHITVGSVPQRPGKACAAIWRNASSRFSSSLENQSCMVPNRITATLGKRWNN